VLLLGSVSCKERAKMAADTPSTKSLLDKILNAPTEEQYREALRQYGPVLAQDIDYLAQQSQSEQPTIRRHAARLLVTTLKGGALRVLRARVADTTDPQVFIIALSGLSHEPDATTLAQSRPQLLAAALADDDPLVLTAAIQIAGQAALPGIHELLARLLQHPSEAVRSAAVEAIAKVGVGPLEAQLKAVLQGATPSSTYPFVVLYRLLGNSDDSSMAAVFADSLKGISVSREADFFNGIQHSRKPWLRALLLDLARGESRNRSAAFVTLTDWPDADTQRELVRICLQRLEAAPPASSPERRHYLVELEPCRRYLGMRAGRNPFSWEEYDAALATAQQLLQHPQ